MNEENLFDKLCEKEVRCRYCHELMERDSLYNCKSCGSAYKEQHWYVEFKNSNMMNLCDYFEMNANPNEMSIEEAIKVINYELANRNINIEKNN